MKPFQIESVFRLDSDVISVAATANFSTICACTTGRTLYLIDPQRRLRSTKDNNKSTDDRDQSLHGEAWATAITDDATRIAVGTALKKPAQGAVYVFDHDFHKVFFQQLNAPVWSVGFSGNGESLVAVTWTNSLFHFSMNKKTGTYELMKEFKVPGKCGLYGAKITRDGRFCVVASYDFGLLLFDLFAGILSSQLPLNEGLYNVAISDSKYEAVVGTRSGDVLWASWNDSGELVKADDVRKSHISDRPIYGVSLSDKGWLIACGSSGGRLHLANKLGETLWTWQSNGEIWSTAITSNGSFVCVASGDHNLTLLKNSCDVSATQEIHSVELSMATSSGTLEDITNYCLSLYQRYGLLEYGCKKLETATELIYHDKCKAIKRFLESCISADHGLSYAHYRLAELLYEHGDYQEAIGHYQHSSRDDVLRSLAQRRLASCFAAAGHPVAASSAWRQSRILHLDSEAHQTLFMLGRSYEEAGQPENAAKVFEMIVARDKDHRKVWEALQDVNRMITRGSKINTTGVTVSLVSEDVTRNVDPAIASVRTARQQERGYTRNDQTLRKQTAQKLFSDDAFSAGVRRDLGALDYSLGLFLKYDFGLPEDEIKKFLETVNAIPIIDRIFSECMISNRPNPNSLDIGSATGRYPTLLGKKGFISYGIDKLDVAVKYANDKKISATDCPFYVLGDARELDKHAQLPLKAFDLVTCMMGTFEHIPRDDHHDLLKQIYNAMGPNRWCFISIWDVECPHLAYLSMYDEVQRITFNTNARTQSEMRQLMLGAGFQDVKIIPFAMLPQSVFYDLGVAKLEENDIQIIVHADLVLASLYPKRHGEMFLAFGHKTT
jgi:tetratricopeptide (TPR) repeat protein